MLKNRSLPARHWLEGPAAVAGAAPLRRRPARPRGDAAPTAPLTKRRTRVKGSDLAPMDAWCDWPSGPTNRSNPLKGFTNDAGIAGDLPARSIPAQAVSTFG